jgi:hypothetical protein
MQRRGDVRIRFQADIDAVVSLAAIDALPHRRIGGRSSRACAGAGPCVRLTSRADIDV